MQRGARLLTAASTAASMAVSTDGRGARVSRAGMAAAAGALCECLACVLEALGTVVSGSGMPAVAGDHREYFAPYLGDSRAASSGALASIWCI